MTGDGRIAPTVWVLVALLCRCLAAGPSLAAAEDPVFSTGDVQVIQTHDATVVVLSGVGPVDRNGHLAAPDDFGGQFKQVWENVRRLAAGAGSPLRNIVSLTVYTARPELQELFTRLRREAFQDWEPPITFATAERLRIPGALLEIHAVAIVKQPKLPR